MIRGLKQLSVVIAYVATADLTVAEVSSGQKKIQRVFTWGLHIKLPVLHSSHMKKFKLFKKINLLLN